MIHFKTITIFILSLFFSVYAFSQKFYSIVDFTNGYLIGGIKGDKYIESPEAKLECKIKDDYKLYNLSKYLGNGTCEKIISDQPPCDDIFYVEIKTSVKPKEDDHVIALSGNWEAYPKILKIENTKQKNYQSIVLDILRKSGVKNPKINLNQVIRTDIEGDGVEEVLISANSHYNSFTDRIRSSYYTILILRKILDGKVENIIITSETKMEDVANVNTIIGILDVDNDGKMEIITSSAYYEGDTTIIYKLDGNKVKEMLAVGCGL